VAGTFKEILMVASDTTKKEVARSFNLITAKMDDSWGAKKLPTAHVKDYMRRFCNQLGLKHQDVVIAEEFALAACPRDGRCPSKFSSLTCHHIACRSCNKSHSSLAQT
jgi:transcription initiation factor TFIIIB Brf1 subunit/transcription initiation factor TFIIB